MIQVGDTISRQRIDIGSLDLMAADLEAVDDVQSFKVTDLLESMAVLQTPGGYRLAVPLDCIA